MARLPGIRSRRLRTSSALLAGCLLSACASEPTLEAPLDVVSDPAPPTRGPRVLLVLLPGAGDTPDDLVRHGMVAMVRQRRIAADVVVVGARFGNYKAQQTVQRVWREVVAPARSRGYDAVWLAGISLGGLGALLYGSGVESDEPDPVAGVLAIAPYLGGREVLDEIAAAGGLRSWRPAASATDFSRRLFDWLRGYGDAAAARPQLFLGVGREDRFHRYVQLVTPLLPADHVIEVPGAHAWQPWLSIWGQMLDRAPLPRLVP